MNILVSRLFSFFLLAHLFAVQGVEAQEVETLEYSLSSPYQSVYTHLFYLQEENYHPQIAGKVFLNGNVAEEEAIDLAIKLKQIYDGKGLFIDMEEISPDVNYKDTISNKARFIVVEVLPQIYLEKVDGRWLYSKSTIKRIPQLHEEVYPFKTDVLLELLPKIGNKSYFGLHLWQLAGILILIILSLAIYYVFIIVFEKIILQTLSRLGYKDTAKNIIHPVAKPFSILVVILFLNLFIRVLQLPVISAHYLSLILSAAVPLFSTLVFYYLVDVVVLYLEKIASKTDTSLDDQLVPLVRKSLKAFVVIIGLLFILQNLNFNITALLAGVSIGGLAFALAAQDTIKNFFGSLMIFVDRPFQVGDWVTAGSEIDGTIEEVGFRSTRIRTFRNSVTYVPNGKLADQTIDNHGLRQFRRFYTTLTITYDTPADKIELFVEGLKKIVESHPKTRKEVYEIHLNDLSAFSINIMFYIFFAVPTWSEELKSRQEVLLEIMKLAEMLDIRFAFPTQTLHMETFPGQETLTPASTPSVNQSRKKMEGYFDAQNSSISNN